MLIIICAVGGQCLPFHETTNVIYDDQEECLAYAHDKAERYPTNYPEGAGITGFNLMDMMGEPEAQADMMELIVAATAGSYVQAADGGWRPAEEVIRTELAELKPSQLEKHALELEGEEWEGTRHGTKAKEKLLADLKAVKESRAFPNTNKRNARVIEGLANKDLADLSFVLSFLYGGD